MNYGLIVNLPHNILALLVFIYEKRNKTFIRRRMENKNFVDLGFSKLFKIL